ncbi:MAG: hypothetical protein JJ913_02185 [Rhizobiaceae bacterium]|nr:hypothetical protein [Rhizobiaceae bacterium]
MAERPNIPRRPRRKRRTYNVRLVRRDLSYEIREIAELFSLHPQAVRRWQQRGLTPIDERRPLLFHGSEIIRFLSETQQGRKKSVPPGQIYCCACRAPRRPVNGVVEVHRRGRTKLILIGVCPECGTRLNRFGSIAKLPEYGNHFAVREAAPERLPARCDAVDKCHLAKETEHA